MKPSPFLYTILATALCCLTACPLPNRYLFNGSKNRIPIRLTSIDPQPTFSLLTIYPWLDTHKKVIVLNGRATNSTSEKATFILSDNVIYSPTDTFETTNYDGPLVNHYHNEQDTIVLQPNETRDISIYFFSRQHYTHRSFRRTNKQDTMLLHLNLFHKKDTVVKMINYHAKSTIF
jgi:hypothetical protein